MKHTKRLLASILALALLLGFGAAASAEENPPAVNWDEFYIITQPQSQTIAHGESFTLSVEVNVPQGVEVTFLWRLGSFYNEAGSVITISPEHMGYPRASRPYVPATWGYSVNVIGTVMDEQGNVIETRTIQSDLVHVTVQAARNPTLWERFNISMFRQFLQFVFLALLVPIGLPLFLIFGIDLWRIFI